MVGGNKTLLSPKVVSFRKSSAFHRTNDNYLPFQPNEWVDNAGLSAASVRRSP